MYNSTIKEASMTKENRAMATKVEKEILNDKSSTNIHRMEDRGQVKEKDNDEGEDEESKYSGVKRALGKQGKFNCYN